LTNGLPDVNQPNQGYDRIELAMAPSNPEVIYASFAYLRRQNDTGNLPSGAMLGIWKTTNAGQNWTKVTTPLSTAKRNIDGNYTTPLGQQGNYDNAIIVHPTDPNIIFVAGLDIYKSTDGGATWSQVSMWTGEAAALNIDTSELSIETKPGQTGTARFNLSNSGTATLSYNITATGPTANAGHTEEGFTARLSGFVNNADIPPLPKFDFAAATAASVNSPLQAHAAGKGSLLPAQLLRNAAADVLMLDDGNNTADDFVGFGAGNTNDFYWLNNFTPSGFGFRLESFDFYMRTESSFANPVYVAVFDANGNILAQASLVLATAPNGAWYTVTLDNPMSFNDGQRFSILAGASFVIPYPAGADFDAAVRNQSFYFSPFTNSYVNLNTISGFQDGAFLIRAKGAKTGGGNQPPVANAQISTNQALVGQSITFDASGSSDPDGQITQYLWNFGDGTTSTQKIVTKAYSRAGTYTATLTVTDNQGATGQASGQITITGGANQPPAARAQISPNPAPVNQSITFDASTSSDPDGQITQYLWNFGDGATSTQKIATKAYSQAGTYNVTLTVTDNGGATGQTTAQVTITSATPSRLTVTPAHGTVAANGTQSITVMFNAQGLTEGNYQGQLTITSNGGNRTIPVKIKISNTVRVEETADLPRTFRLEQNYPNPFRSEATSPARSGGNPETMIRYELPQASHISLAVFALDGRRVAQLESGLKTAGVHLVRWEGRDHAGNRVPSGIYFYRLEAVSPIGATTSLTKKLTVMK